MVELVEVWKRLWENQLLLNQIESATAAVGVTSHIIKNKLLEG